VGRNGGGIPGREVVEVSVVCWRLCDVLLLRSDRTPISVPFLWSRGLEGVQFQWGARRSIGTTSLCGHLVTDDCLFPLVMLDLNEKLFFLCV
jgi:hypothetical protein